MYYIKYKLKTLNNGEKYVFKESNYWWQCGI